MKNKICCIFNVAPIYNAPIYKLMDLELKCDFYLGDRIHLPIKLMQYSDLTGYRKTLKYIPLISNFYWQKDAVKQVFKPYNKYIITGEVYCLSNWMILLLCIFTSKKTFLWTHGWYGNESLIKVYLKRIFFRLSSHVLLYGDYARNLMLEDGFNKEKLSCIYNSLDYDKQLEIRKQNKKTSIYKDKFKNNNPVLFYIGRIQKNKRLDLLIQAMCILNERSLNCNLVIIGEEAEKTGIINLIEENGLNEQVWMYGACFDEIKIGELVYNADLCVSPGNVGLTAIHSLMYGTPVITHNNYCEQGPEFEAINNGVTGAFFDENDGNNLADTIYFWLSSKAKQRDVVRSESYKIIDEKYNPHAQIKLLHSIIGS